MDTITPLAVERYTAICTEDYPGYPDPLIVTIDVAEGEDIEEAIYQNRYEEVGDEKEGIDGIRRVLSVHFVWKGDFFYDDVVIDNRI